MTNEQLKQLEDKLWDSANALRAYGGIKASDYAVPVLGLIFLKFADNKYSQYEEEIRAIYERDKGTRMEESIDKIAQATCGFYLPDHARFHYLLNLPGDQKMAVALREAMEGIEAYLDESFQGVLPTEAYFDIESKKDDILPSLLKTFSDIPPDATGDLFGKIYEYFLGKFALSEGQKGGEFFTPTSVVRFIVEVIEPYKGQIFDPACGSGGMFVQSATFIRQAKQDLNDIYVCGQEFMGETVRLAKMNLLVNNLRGEIREVNSYDSDPFDSFGRFDYVMANPPFNVKSVKESTVKDDQRFYAYGLPKTQGKKDDRISDANYLWISLFATSLNEQGRAGFVMPNSASDARHAEYEIRKKIVDSGIVDCMVSMPSNMFFTVTLPATLWFFDKAKVQTDRKDKILFLDARNVYRQIDRAHREWTEEQQQNLAAIVRLYRGETERYLELIHSYLLAASEAMSALPEAKAALQSLLTDILGGLQSYQESAIAKLTPAKRKKLEEAKFAELLAAYQLPTISTHTPPDLSQISLDNGPQLKASQLLKAYLEAEDAQWEALRSSTQQLLELWKTADKYLKLKNDKTWGTVGLSRRDKDLEATLEYYTKAQENAKYWHTNLSWLQERFPEGIYRDVTGLCKVADPSEFVVEQDYSLNAGRYVGVEIEGDSTTESEFKSMIGDRYNRLLELRQKAETLQNKIDNSIEMLLK